MFSNSLEDTTNHPKTRIGGWLQNYTCVALRRNTLNTDWTGSYNVRPNRVSWFMSLSTKKSVMYRWSLKWVVWRFAGHSNYEHEFETHQGKLGVHQRYILSVNSYFCQRTLETLHPNISCMRHPDHIGAKGNLFEDNIIFFWRRNSFCTDSIEFWSHHEKVHTLDFDSIIVAWRLLDVINIRLSWWIITMLPLVDSISALVAGTRMTTRLPMSTPPTSPRHSSLDKITTTLVSWIFVMYIIMLATSFPSWRVLVCLGTMWIPASLSFGLCSFIQFCLLGPYDFLRSGSFGCLSAFHWEVEWN